MDSRFYSQALGMPKGRAITPSDGKTATVWVDFAIRKDLRARVTTALVNAGSVLLPALPTVRWRLFDIILISIGGAASGATDVRILGTRAGASVALGIAAVAGLTQSTVLRAGSPFATAGTASIVCLADGASFTQLDANTAVTIGKTGGSLATSTNIDVLLGFVADPQ